MVVLDCVVFGDCVLCYVVSIFFSIMVRAKFCQNERFYISTFLRGKFKMCFLSCTLFFSVSVFLADKSGKNVHLR